MHVTGAQKPAQISDIIRDEPSPIFRHVNVCCLEIAVKQTAEAKQEGEPERNEQRPQRDSKHPAVTAVNESSRTDEQPNWNPHPPRREEAHHRGAHPLRQRCVYKTKLPELELGKVLRGNV